MAQKLKMSSRLRPVDLARGHGLSTQAVRNYEGSGILPPAERTPHGYRVYTPLHAAALRAFLALVPGHGHGRAASIMQAVNEGAAEDAYRLIDESHAQLLDDRGTIRAVESALRDLEPTAPAASAASGRTTVSGPGGMFIGPLAEHLGIGPATLRTWEEAGLVHPHRDPLTGYRVYDESAVRDARMTQQLRRAGYLLEQIAPLITHVRTAGGTEPLEAALTEWRDRLSARGRAMLRGAAELDAYLRSRG
ncbi:TioE family transcriptional regulator [Streptomyces sp. NPDC048361]|uniref:TioE family transcriptional regulator n=1 Tax=Streptomyces sp. NPDC048361 TaxID=3154720 RepID=UPI0034439416